jgi:CubicO group peptidase (beta-lactamase class C family)
MQDFAPERLQYSYEYWLSQHPYYGTRISARDLARFGQLFLQRGIWQGSQVIPAEWVGATTEAHSSTGKKGTYSGYGYMWWVAAKDYDAIGKGSYAASGYGGHTVEILPDLNTVIVLRVNTDAAGWQPIDDPDEAVLGILRARIE